jgi:hypothetical protein
MEGFVEGGGSGGRVLWRERGVEGGFCRGRGEWREGLDLYQSPKERDFLRTIFQMSV